MISCDSAAIVWWVATAAIALFVARIVQWKFTKIGKGTTSEFEREMRWVGTFYGVLYAIMVICISAYLV